MNHCHKFELISIISFYKRCQLFSQISKFIFLLFGIARDGGTKSALFCAIRDVISRITYDREVDVYMTVRKVQNIRPGAVTSEVNLLGGN